MGKVMIGNGHLEGSLLDGILGGPVFRGLDCAGLVVFPVLGHVVCKGVVLFIPLVRAFIKKKEQKVRTGLGAPSRA